MAPAESRPGAHTVPVTPGRPVKAVAADWSGAATGEQRSLWLAECDPLDPWRPNQQPRLARLQGMTRDGAADRLLALAERDPALVVGLDFGFSLPRWYLAETAVASAADLWAHHVNLGRWLADCPPPFWGRPGRPRPVLAPERHWRRTELATSPRPKSVFQIGGAGSVGTASLRGMPVLHRLRQAGFAVWPMDPPRLPLVLEVWPRLHIGSLVKSRSTDRREWLAARPSSVPRPLRRQAEQSADAFDATAAALGLAADLAAVCRLSPVDDPVVRLEGWIWGVPMGAPPAGATVGPSSMMLRSTGY